VLATTQIDLCSYFLSCCHHLIFGHDLAIYCLQKEQKGVQMSVDKNIMNIQVPAGKTISIPAAAAAAAVIDSTTT
jgi:hypothetical protein